MYYSLNTGLCLSILTMIWGVPPNRPILVRIGK